MSDSIPTTAVAVPEQSSGASFVDGCVSKGMTAAEVDKLVALRERASGYQPLFKAGTPDMIVASATSHANALAHVIEQKRLYKQIGGKKHVYVEGWTLLGSMLGVFPVCVWTKLVTAENGATLGWEARVEARTRTGEVVGAAESQCLRSEKTWAGRDDFSLRSMAQTRATSKALRMPLGFVMVLAGYEATPSDEMGGEDYTPTPQQVKQDTEEAELVSRQQVADLIDMVSKKGADKEKLKEWAGVPRYEELTVAKWRQAMSMLKQKPDKAGVAS